MTTIPVKLKVNGYSIVVGEKILEKTASLIKNLGLGQDAIIITHPVINRLYGKRIVSNLKKNKYMVKIIEVPQGEHSKSVNVAFKVMEKIARYDVMKKPFIIALGGGVIGDLAGYIAAAYKRGIPYIQIPTTFLAQIDSAIGGKVAIDLAIGKNLVGAFYQPKIVISDISVLKTLSQRQMKNGMAEAIKYGIIMDKQLFELLEKKYALLMQYDLKILKKVVIVSSKIKADVVVKDERETTGLRAILNYGHTVGHAIEAGGKYKIYQHGEAIGLGMRVAGDIAHQLGMIAPATIERINRLISLVGLPDTISNVTLKSIFDHIKHDKKFISGTNRFVLATRLGKVELVEGIDWEIIRQATKEYMA